jgi:AdoMet-dependent heme synthase
LRFERQPVLVFWETTRACDLSCVHCRASANPNPFPGELTEVEGREVLNQIAAFGRPSPIVVFTGGDPLKRKDLLPLTKYASDLGLRFAISPAVTELLTPEVLRTAKEIGAASISVSLDGARAETHDAIRRAPGTYDRTIRVIRDAVGSGLNIQVNTAVMRRNLPELPDLFHLLRTLGVPTWEVFFLIQVGRAWDAQDLTVEEFESVCHFLYDASRYRVVLRPVEAPFLRRVATQRREGKDVWKGALYRSLRSRLVALEGPAEGPSTLAPSGTLDGDGILFVAHDGSVFPGGFLPYTLGNIRQDNLVAIYRENDLLKRIRGRQLKGPCGDCPFKAVCGGSRARAFSSSGDPLASDPACLLAA